MHLSLRLAALAALLALVTGLACLAVPAGRPSIVYVVVQP